MNALYTKPGRLSEVLALIQVLSLDEHAHRSLDGLETELQGKPCSSKDWDALAREHPEFFRVSESEHGISLVARHVLPREHERRPQLSAEFTSVLLQTAITLHGHEVQAKEWWKSVVPVIATLGSAFVASATTLFALWLNGWCKP